jgi:hypothetical protein
VVQSFVPYYKNISIELMLAFARPYEDVWKYFPEERDLDKLPRQFVIDVLATVIGKPFSDWVAEKVKERNR